MVDDRHAYLILELRRASLLCRLWQTDIDSVGVALKAGLITSEQAIKLLDPDALAFLGLRLLDEEAAS